MNNGRKRKGRSDRTHVIYQLNVGKHKYIGITYLRKGNADKTVRGRILQHWYNATVRGRGWKLSEMLRTLDSIDDVGYEVLAKIRGKVKAHDVERDLIAKIKPKLNTDVRPKKG